MRHLELVSGERRSGTRTVWIGGHTCSIVDMVVEQKRMDFLTIHSTSMSFEGGLNALASFDIFHATLVNLLALPRYLNDLRKDLLGDTDDTVHIGNDAVSWIYRYSGEASFGTMWVDIEGNVYCGWTCEGRLTQSRVASRENRVPEGIVFLDVPTATRDNHTECFADLRAGRHKSAPDRVLRSCGDDPSIQGPRPESGRTELGGALITMTVPAGAVSMK